jgi:NADPH-dependent 7-cyano-7-deazaguanine reductase QueF
MVDDIVRAADPLWVTLGGDFTPRGGISTRIIRSWERKLRSSKRAR